MRGGGRLSLMFASAISVAACLALSDVEGSERPDGSVTDASTGGIPNTDAWQGDDATGENAESDVALPQAFPARGVVFDGVTDWLERAGQFAGAADSNVVSGSLWLKRVGFGAAYTLGPEAEGAGDHNQMQLTLTDHFRLSWRRAGGGQACDLMSEKPLTDTTSWHHIAFSVDVTDVAKSRLYVDGVSNLAAGFSVSGYPMDHTGSQWGLFANNNGVEAYDGEVAELWLALDRYVDFDDPANLAKFRDAAGKPVDLGASGELATGTPPAIYLSVREGDLPGFFGTNRGTAGDFTVHGVLEPSQTSPSE